jgi:hypothetical protein
MSHFNVQAANKLPNLTPNPVFPGSSILVTVGNAVLGIIVVLLVIAFFVGIFRIVASFAGRKNGGSTPYGLALASILGLAFVFAGTAFLSQWVDFLHV